MRVCVLGRGKLGRSLQRELVRAGVDCTLSAGRFKRLRAADVYLLAVPDAAIRELAARLAPSLQREHVVLHCAGARDQHELTELASDGIATGVFHPLLSFAGAPLSFTGATFTVLGSPRAVRVARHLARQLSARVVMLKHAPGPAYHAAAALLANGAAALAQLSAQMLVPLGFSQKQAEQALSTLLSSVASNVGVVGVPAALTGPVSRGDSATVAAHLAALQQLDPGLARAYAAVLPAILESARAQGLHPRLAQKLSRLIP